MRLALLFTIIGLGSTVTVDNCPPELTRDGNLTIFGDTCYRFYHVTYGNELAEMNCKFNMGRLVMPKTQELNDFLIEQLKKLHWKESYLWFGLKRDFGKGQTVFEWDDGSPLTWTNWAPGQTPKELTDEFQMDNAKPQCATMHFPEGTWYHSSCGPKPQRGPWKFDKTFICEFPATFGVVTTTEPTKDVCPVITCQLFCGIKGYKKDKNNCFICECQK